ncbi:Mov34/MPN/PAD-1 family protein [Novosphingobium sp. FSW06-99]|uniref:Mov34/MPN/PAD-1 family protein n=1 Tax=Novosphingobium sp. FSW06-99 TaxID=1739113 RepID=UPI000AEC5CF3|nr:M67 family metallopeptidase [Novosphingobium sp. FSW06-99]
MARYRQRMPVCICASAHAAMIEAARRAHPHEACGLLLGAHDRVITAQQAANLAADPARMFDIDPAALIAAHRAARAGGPQILGYFHSHPNGVAAPSPTDAAMAAHDGRIWAIIGAGTVTLWRDQPSGFEPLSYAVVAG